MSCCCGLCCTAMSTVNPVPGSCQTPTNKCGSFSLSNLLSTVQNVGLPLASSLTSSEMSTAPISTVAGTVGAKTSISSGTLAIIAIVVIALVLFLAK